MLIDSLKLALAGLMVLLDFIGVNNANQAVLDLAGKLNIEDIYHVQVVDEIKVDQLELPEIQLADAAPYLEDPLSYPLIQASSAMVIDVDTAGVLYEKNASEQRAMASVTKMMTAVVALENIDMNSVITVTAADTDIEPIVMGLLPGEDIYAIDVLKGLLIKSGNDAALMLARVGGDGSTDNFIKMMNQKASKLGLTNTSFANPHGLDEDGQYSSAKDLALLAKYIMKDETSRSIVNTKETTVTSTDGSYSHYLKNTNELLDSYLDVRGVKTGFTDNAGQVLVTMANQNGHEIICVVMNSPDRFQESKMLIDWAFNNYYWE